MPRTKMRSTVGIQYRSSIELQWRNQVLLLLPFWIVFYNLSLKCVQENDYNNNNNNKIYIYIYIYIYTLKKHKKLKEVEG